jgi:hypothetical protein
MKAARMAHPTIAARPASPVASGFDVSNIQLPHSRQTIAWILSQIDGQLDQSKVSLAVPEAAQISIRWDA